MKKRKPLSKQQKLQISALISECKKDGEIAKLLGTTRQVVSYHRHKLTKSDHADHVTTGGKHINVRLSDYEYQEFKKLAQSLDLTISDAGRRLVRHSVGILDLHPDEINAIHKARVELNAVGRNLNQLAAIAQRGSLNWNNRDSALLERLEKKVDGLSTTIATVVRAGRARTVLAPILDLEARAYG